MNCLNHILEEKTAHFCEQSLRTKQLFGDFVSIVFTNDAFTEVGPMHLTPS